MLIRGEKEGSGFICQKLSVIASCSSESIWSQGCLQDLQRAELKGILGQRKQSQFPISRYSVLIGEDRSRGFLSYRECD